MDFEGLTPEQREKAAACKSADEILELAKNEGIELTEGQLNQIAGGAWDDEPLRCPVCGSTNLNTNDYQGRFVCEDCGNRFE